MGKSMIWVYEKSWKFSENREKVDLWWGNDQFIELVLGSISYRLYDIVYMGMATDTGSSVS